MVAFTHLGQRFLMRPVVCNRAGCDTPCHENFEQTFVQLASDYVIFGNMHSVFKFKFNQIQIGLNYKSHFRNISGPHQ